MGTSSYASRLRYLDAADVDDSVVDFDGLNVRGHDGQALGNVDGFIVDLASGRVLYVVVDSGGWFRSRRFLAPIGHAVVDRDRRALVFDISKERLGQYPKFEEERFSGFTDDDLSSYEGEMAAACCPDEPPGDGSGEVWPYETRRHYRQPDWWTGGAYAHERLRPVEAPMYRLAPPILEDDEEDDADRADKTDGRARDVTR